MRNFLSFALCCWLLISCGEAPIPKPKGYLRLVYPKNTYKKFVLKKPYTFEFSKYSKIKILRKNWIDITYPKLKASIDITYYPVKNNLIELISDTQKLVFKHTIKADLISSNDFVNPKNQVFGSIYDITGDVASQIQFYSTDSTRNFMRGALYFYAKPNYDSLLPAIAYIRKDIVHLMETLQWKNYKEKSD